MVSISKFFERAESLNASDVHIVGGEKLYVRVDGVLSEMDKKAVSEKELRKAIYDLLSAEQKEKFNNDLELDFGMKIGSSRFRVNIHQQMGNIALAARIIPSRIPTPEELGFSEKILSLSNLKNGLVLVSGPTGCGKSTTLASIIENINQTRKAHIITVEDPVEFVFEDKECLIEQREVGIDTHSFPNALKHVLRQDPDIILIGEMRDPETIATALTAAETGHLVFSTLHTPTAAEAVERIVDVFTGDKQKQILVQLSSVLRAVISQRLYPKRGGGRIAAREILIGTSAVANMIRENNIAQIKSAIQTGGKDGMLTLENAIKQLIKSDLLLSEEASK